MSGGEAVRLDRMVRALLENEMNYDEWFADNADDLALHGLKATARMIWDAAIAAERDACAQMCNDYATRIRSNGFIAG